MEHPRIRLVDDEAPPETYSFEALRDDPASQTSGTPADRILEAVECMSRRIEDLARELNCLGHFDDDDGPRAA